VAKATILFGSAALSVASLAPTGLAVAEAAAAPRVHTIYIDKMRFGPVPQGIRQGDVILWVNKDLFRHTATARDGSFNVDLQPGKSGRTPIRKAGATHFFCKYHLAMKGVLVVTRNS
jgi:plastocyanin